MPTPELAAIKVTAEQILSNPTWDLLLLFFLAATGFFYGLWAGKRMIVSTILYTYVALSLMPIFPIDRLSEALQVRDLFFVKVGLFLVLYLLLIFLLGRGGAQSFAVGNPWWQVSLLSFIQAGLLIHISLGFIPADKIKMLAPITKTIFANPDLRFWWLILPLAILIALRWMDFRQEKRW